MILHFPNTYSPTGAELPTTALHRLHDAHPPVVVTVGCSEAIGAGSPFFLFCWAHTVVVFVIICDD